MTKRIFRSIFLISLAAVILVFALTILALYSAYESRAVDGLKSEASYVLKKLADEQNEADFFDAFYTDNRVTLIAPGGTVLYDSTTDAQVMENHADRPEVITALQSGDGESARYSNTLSEQTIYYAVKTDGGNVLRVSQTQSSVFGILWDMLTMLFLIIVGVAVLSLIMARYMSRHIIAPINALNLDQPFENDIYDELGPLLLRIERQHQEIAGKIREITEKQREFAAVTENMREGLVLISGKGEILSINKSAARIFETDEETSAGNHILSLNRSIALQNVVEGAIGGSSTQAQLTIQSRYYQIMGNPVESLDGTMGVVILILDVTDRQNAERSRREFTANVSHELKTPLTSISGFAEIMKDGTARTEDMRGFSERIYREANRLISLIDDILRLSELDEQVRLPDKESVDLLNIAQDVTERLRVLAEKRQIRLFLHGDHAVVFGYKKILEEMIGNLVDNAIKYNTPGGSVSVRVRNEDGYPAVVVEDTGIGIPKEHQPYVFERFYRVDKSRSKETGGTGLGLSIVKHGALIHGAKIELDSTVNSGTSVDIRFPKPDTDGQEKP